MWGQGRTLILAKFTTHFNLSHPPSSQFMIFYENNIGHSSPYTLFYASNSNKLAQNTIC